MHISTENRNFDFRRKGNGALISEGMIKKRRKDVKEVISLAHLHFQKGSRIYSSKERVKKSSTVCSFYLTYLLFFDILLLYLARRTPWKTKSPKAS